MGKFYVENVTYEKELKIITYRRELNNMKDSSNIKIRFETKRPRSEEINVEYLWAIPNNDGSYTIDNIPFETVGVSLDDKVLVDKINGEVVFSSIKDYSGNRTIQIIINDEKKTDDVVTFLKKLNCEFEKDSFGMLAVNIPKNVDYSKIVEFLENQKDAMDYQESSISDKDRQIADFIRKQK